MEPESGPAAHANGRGTKRTGRWLMAGRTDAEPQGWREWESRKLPPGRAPAPRGFRPWRARLRAHVRLLLLGVCAVPLPAQAQTVWTGATSNDWFTAGNWNPAAVPGSGTSVEINTAAQNPTVVGGAGAQANQLTLGNSVGQTGDLTIDGATSTLSMTNGGGFFLVGNFGSGDVTVSNGATLTTFSTAIGNQTGSTGAVTVTGTNSQ